MELTLKLVRRAKKSGGDRYEVELEGEDKPWVVYFPQSISRTKGIVSEIINLTIDVVS